MKQIGLKLFAVAVSTIAVAALSMGNAEARRLYVGAYHHYHPYNDYVADTSGLPWYAVRAYYADGPWSGPYWSYTGWSDYAAQNGIACEPGTLIKGGDGIMYVCQ